MHGKSFYEDVYKINWHEGPLSNDHFDEFSFVKKIGAKPQVLYLPVKQECVNGEELYCQESRGEEKNLHEYKFPAPKLTIIETDHVHIKHEDRPKNDPQREQVSRMCAGVLFSSD